MPVLAEYLLAQEKCSPEIGHQWLTENKKLVYIIDMHFSGLKMHLHNQSSMILF